MRQHRSRRGVLRAGGVCVATLLAGCGGGGGGDGNTPAGTPTGEPTTGLGEIDVMQVGLLLPNTTETRYANMATAFEEFRTDESGGDGNGNGDGDGDDGDGDDGGFQAVRGSSTLYDAADDAATQADQVGTAVEEGAAFLVLAGIDDGEVRDAVAAAVEEGVPVIEVGDPVAPEHVATRVLVDQELLGGQTGNLLVELLQELSFQSNYNVVEIAGPPDGEDTQTRRDGFEQFVVQQATLTDLGDATVDDDTAAARTAMAGLLAETEETIHGVFAHTARQAVGVHEAVAESDLDDAAVVAIGDDPDWFELIDGNEYYGATVPSAGGLLWAAIQQGELAATGTDLDDTTAVWGEAVTGENVGEYLDTDGS